MAQRKIGSGGIGNNIEFAGNYIQLPAGTTAERPVSPENGQMRFNTTLGKLEQYNVNGWQAIDTPPIVSSLSYSGSLLAADPAGGETITVTGSNFTSSVTVTIDGTLAPTVSVVDANNITFTTPAKTAGDYDVTVTNDTGLGATLTGGISYNGTPSFSTAAGKIGNDLAPGSTIQTITIVAAEPDGGTLAYSVTSGALPTGLSLASDGDITGTTPTPATTTTYNFTVTATDDENQTNSRAFNLVVLRPVYAYSIPQSLMFNRQDSQHMTWNLASAGNRKTWTLSFWLKRSEIDATTRYIFEAGIADNDTQRLYGRFNTDYTFTVGTGTQHFRTTSRVFRDPSAWYHFVIAFDTTQATASDRFKLYINGTQETAFVTSNDPGLNTDYGVFDDGNYYIGRSGIDGGGDFAGYITEVHLVEGSALTPTSFAETYNDVWIPKAYSGTYGTNGFHLPMTNDTAVEAFNAVVYKGTGGHTTVNGFGFAPDLVWIKNRYGAQWFQLYDRVRGVTKAIASNTSNAETTRSDGLLGFEDDGITLGGLDANVNGAGGRYIAWAWKAGDSNSVNNDGTVESTVRVNQTYGFSIVSYTGPGASGGSVGHGLGATPSLIIQKNRSAGENWRVYHSGLSADYYINLSGSAGQSLATSVWSSAPDSNVFNIGNDAAVSGSGNSIIAYCWAEKAGYSSFGTYEGNGSADGPEITTGFRPAFLICKTIDASGNWRVVDDVRSTTNPRDVALNLNEGGQNEFTQSTANFTDTGFKIIDTGGANTNGETFIYIAFADTRDNAFWRDESGNNNDWQPVNTGAYRVTTDTPTE